MNRKVVVITGATSGIGLEMARKLAHSQCHVVMACRNMEKAVEVRDKIINPNGDYGVDILRIDMASLRSIRQFVEAFNCKYEKLDVLINNAGVFCDTLQWTSDGFEMTMGVNYLGPFLLTRLLSPILTRDSGARIINITSRAAFHGKLSLGENTFNSKTHGFKAYAASKLAQLLFTIDFAQEIKDSGVTVNAAYPGRVATNIWQGKTLLMKMVAPIMNRKSISASEGAETGVYLATSSKVADVTGAMFDREEVVEYSPVCEDDDLRRRLMALTREAIDRAE